MVSKQFRSGIKRGQSSNTNPRALEKANDVEKNPGPKSPKKDVSLQTRRSSRSRSISVQRKPSEVVNVTPCSATVDLKETVNDNPRRDSALSTASTGKEQDKISRLESEIALLQVTLEGIDNNVLKLQSSVDQLRPIYNDAKLALGSITSQQQKNNLVFYGIAPDPLEIDMMSEPDFCRDILETRIKGILREHLKISRDIPFHQVARIHSARPVNGVQPIVACFANWKDKENILRQGKLLKGAGINITEDISNKSFSSGVKVSGSNNNKTRTSVDETSGDETNREERELANGYTSSSASGTE
ncbi:uncharacterized protein LOC111707929 [Eurytemora carolleeae]|uniref:uncharacterized protein LOC111707929 n=1 Tax=Eurytemora carolleeae TaxID=1294199 RepID=UPI000C789DA4|nr:uncharacterized protein LOC111707929 [Eurytemora carolleeae]|eukprot:XP_023336885.1 uncharacterized protein LOC111707929 [Eurytemora affinis]